MDSKEWVPLAQARDLPGLRLVVTGGVPGPWGEAAKGVFRVKGIPFAKVRQDAGQRNDDLFAWTGHRNAPVAVYEDELPRTGWVEILHLAERLAPDPPLIPADPTERALFFGLSHELMGEGGLGWCRRLMLVHQMLGDAEAPAAPTDQGRGRMLWQYGYRRDAALRAPQRVAEVLGLLSARLRVQREAGHAYLMGPALTALDIYAAAMTGLVSPLPPEQCPTPDAIRGVYVATDPVVTRALDPALLEHRDLVYAKHLGLPVDL